MNEKVSALYKYLMQINVTVLLLQVTKSPSNKENVEQLKKGQLHTSGIKWGDTAWRLA